MLPNVNFFSRFVPMFAVCHCGLLIVLKVACNGIFHILMCLQHRVRMSENFINRGLSPVQ